MNEELNKEKIFTVDFGQHVRAMITISNNEIKSIEAIDGCGNERHYKEIEITPNN